MFNSELTKVEFCSVVETVVATEFDVLLKSTRFAAVELPPPTEAIDPSRTILVPPIFVGSTYVDPRTSGLEEPFIVEIDPLKTDNSVVPAGPCSPLGPSDPTPKILSFVVDVFDPFHFMGIMVLLNKSEV